MHGWESDIQRYIESCARQLALKSVFAHGRVFHKFFWHFEYIYQEIPKIETKLEFNWGS